MDKKYVLFPGIAAAATCVIYTGSVQANTDARGFACGVSKGSPTTYAIKANGSQVPVIRWTSTVFDAAGWSQERRCKEVSNRFNNLLKQGRLTYITTGRINSLPVICTASSKSSGCSSDSLLYTLKPGQNATATLLDLLEIRVKARGPLNETSERLYINIDELINAPGSTGRPDPVNTLF